MIRFVGSLLLILFTAAVSIGHAMPSKIILMRHAEEPTIGDEGIELSEIGWERAAGLPQLFENEGITHLIALKPHKKKASIRSIQTLQPISEALGLDIQTPYTREEVSDLVQMLAESSELEGQVVLIAWQHETLSEIAHQLGATTAPKKWGKAFDRYWVLEFENGEITSFKNLPQRLLDGDSKK